MRMIWLTAAVLAGFAASVAMADDAAPPVKPSAKHKKSPAAQPPPPPPPLSAGPVVLPNPPTPVTQAMSVGLSDCVPVLSAMAGETLTAAYDVQSGWHRTDPSHHVFQSVAGLQAPANKPPDSFVALIAAPGTAGGCDGVSVQVLPLAGTCDTARKVIERGGKQIGTLLASQIMVDASGKRLILLPGAGDTCIAISVDSRFGAR